MELCSLAQMDLIHGALFPCTDGLDWDVHDPFGHPATLVKLPPGWCIRERSYIMWHNNGLYCTPSHVLQYLPYFTVHSCWILCVVTSMVGLPSLTVARDIWMLPLVACWVLKVTVVFSGHLYMFLDSLIDYVWVCIVLCLCCQCCENVKTFVPVYYGTFVRIMISKWFMLNLSLKVKI